MLKIWYFFLLCWLSLRLDSNPGLKVRITQKGLDYGRRIGMELLKQAVLKETFPSWSGQESFSVVKVNYVISRLRINAVDFPETSASFVPGTGISVSVAKASATVSADWRIQAWLLKDQGELTVSISGLFIAVTFQVSWDSTGHLSTMLHSCQLIIASVKVKLSGGSSWIYSFQSGYLEMSIHTKLDKSLCLNIKYKIQMMDAQLRKHKVLSQIDAFAQVDYSLVSSPAIFKSHINLDLKQKSLVENFLSYALQGLVIPVINDKLVKGFPLLNLAHTSLAGPVIKMNQGHLGICTDVHYQLEDEEDLHSHS